MAPKSVDRDSYSQNNLNGTTKSVKSVRHFEKGKGKLYIHIIFLFYYHCAGMYGLYLMFTSAKWETIGFAFLTNFLAILGITAGAHRLWSHKSFKATMPLQILLMVFQSIAFQKTVYTWVRDHRLHHKHSDTAGDPHNATRGFFFSHIGWLLSEKSVEVIEGQKNIDMSDINNNPVLSFQRRYATPVLLTFGFILPTIIPMYSWGETFTNAWHVNILRFVYTLHVTCCINSVAHKFGKKPYDKNIMATQNPVFSFFTLGEGFHNYHHVFPGDYKTAELGNGMLNTTTWFIDFFAKIGWAYDLKTASDDVVRNRAIRTGDGTDMWGHEKTK